MVCHGQATMQSFKTLDHKFKLAVFCSKFKWRKCPISLEIIFSVRVS